MRIKIAKRHFPYLQIKIDFMHGSKDYIIHLSKRTVYSTTVSVPKYDAKPSIVSAYKVPNIKFNLLIFQKQIYQFHTQYVIPCKGQQ